MDLDLKHLLSLLRPGQYLRGTRVVGIDIGSSSIKVVELKAGDERPELCTYGELQLGPYIEQDVGTAVSLPQEQLVEALVDVVRESQVKTKTGILAIPLASSFVTIIPVTTTADETIESKLRVEARKYIPLPLPEVTLDWSLLSQTDDKENGTQTSEVLLAAVQNDVLTGFRDLANAVALSTDQSEIEVFSVLRGTVGDRPDAPYAVIDMGAQTSKLYIAKDNVLRRIHRVYDGGARCSKRLSELLSVSFEEAENQKRLYTPEVENASEILKAFRSAADRPLSEFKRVIDTYEQETGEQLTRIVLTGGVSSFYEFASYASDVLGRPAYVENIFSRTTAPAFLNDTLQVISPSFAVALGAALRAFEK